MSIFGDILMHYGVGPLDNPPGRGSGRFPYGSGKNPNQHGGDLLSRIDKLKKAGLTDAQIAKELGMSTTRMRAEKALATTERNKELSSIVMAYKDEGYNNSEIARLMGFKSESSVRHLLTLYNKVDQTHVIAQKIKDRVDEVGMVDVGSGVERELGCSTEKLKQALILLEQEGYNNFGGRVAQVTNPGKFTTLKVICPPGTEYKTNEKGEKTSAAIYDYNNINSLIPYQERTAAGVTKSGFIYPASMDSSRLSICYAEDGGTERDGLIEIRRGVADLSLGESHYAQVRILVDGTHYLKGMAVYSDDLPDGVDVKFHTNKHEGTPACGTKTNTVLKLISSDPDNPFGALIKEDGGQSFYDDPKGEYTDPYTGNKQSLSLINKKSDEGDWSDWSDTLPSQFLSKQNQKLINRQLTLTYDDKKAEYDEICSLTNPTVKKVLLQSFANDCDSSAEHLKAAALPRQKYQVILPVPSIKDTEVFAPGYEDGETVALIRYPHGGTFEIPILTVNNKNKDAIKMLGGKDTTDVVCINSTVAGQLSGADFDGDTVMVIPCNSDNSDVRITAQKGLTALKGFEPKTAYGCDLIEEDSDGIKHYYQNDVEFKHMNNTQTEMGKISNLITDMTILGATEDELARAVKHSMVVIDAEKHHLNYKQSEKDNNITALKKSYQKHTHDDGYGGAATLISRAKSEVSVTKRQGQPKVNLVGKDWYDPSLPEGALIYKTVKESTYNVAKVNRRSTDDNATIRINSKGTVYVQMDEDDSWLKVTGKTTDSKGVTLYSEGDRVNASLVGKTKTQKSTQMAETQDAMTLVSATQSLVELAYADYANKLKALANSARKEIASTGKIEYSASAKQVYLPQVQSLTTQLNTALLNAPRERMAQIIANGVVAAKTQANPDMTKKEVKKASQLALTQARASVGAARYFVTIDDKEWEAIQSGAISESQLLQILNHTDNEVIRQYATPRAMNELSATQKGRIKAYVANGYTYAEIAKALGVSTTTVSSYLSEG